MLARSPVRVRVLHRDPLARLGVRSMLGLFPEFEVLEDGDDAATRGEVAPDVVQVADPESALALAAATPADSAVAVVLVDGADRERELRHALNCRIRGYLVHGYSTDDLARSVRMVHGGLRFLCWRAAGRLAESIAAEALTDREEAVLDLVVDGLCNKAVARRLDIALGTVKSHLKSAYAKLGVASRTQAIAVLNRRGLLERRPSLALGAHEPGREDTALDDRLPHWNAMPQHQRAAGLAHH